MEQENINLERFEDALIYTSRLHKEQFRKHTGAPYLSHLLSVCSLVMENGGDEDEAIAALLHDAVEDQGGVARLDDIRIRYGHAVAEVVAGCSDYLGEDKPPWKQRKTAFIERLATASSSVLLVSSADKLHNARCILHDYKLYSESIWRNFNGNKNGQLWYYRSLIKIFSRARPSPLVEELNNVVNEIVKLSEVTNPEMIRY